MRTILNYIATEPDIAAPANPKPLPVPARGAARFENVVFKYPSRPDRSFRESKPMERA